MESINQTQVNLDGLLEILGKNLYSSPCVVLRELIQNAHDGCHRHQFEHTEQHEYRITIRANNDDNTLEIIDTGSGLTESEIHDYLATIGSGYTRLLRSNTDADDLIGYFGLGFLSAYVVSDQVEVYTTSYKAPDKTWRFATKGGKTFSIKPWQQHPVGTRVRLTLKSEFSSLSSIEVLRSLIKTYCCLLPIPIYLEAETVAVNQMVPPWCLPETMSPLQKRKKILAFASVFEDDFEPICCLPIPDNNPLNLKGVLWIQDGASYASSDNRNVSVFIRHMFISNDEADLLPKWAGFVGGLFESPAFNPTASRESLQKDAYYKAAAQLIKEELIKGLRQIVLSEPESWRRINTRHSQSLLGAALSDERLFSVCSKQLKVPTNYGDMTLPHLLKQSGGVLHIKTQLEASVEEMLFKARKIPLVSGFLYGAADFCYRYCDIEKVDILMLGSIEGESTYLPKVDENEVKLEFQQELHILSSLMIGEDEQLLFSRFEPSAMPMLIIEDQEVKLKQRIEQEQADRRIGQAALALARIHTESIKREKVRRIYLNLNNAVIKRLFALDPLKKESVAHLLRSFFDSMNFSESISVVDGSDGLSSDKTKDFTTILNTFNQSLLALMD